MVKFLKILVLISAAVMVVSWFFKDDIPPKADILPQLLQEPSQVAVNKDKFEVERGGIVYTVKPLYDYELNALVVSEHSSDSWFDYYHKKWDDHINEKDICVVWGSNLESGAYEYIDFSNGSWTCYFKTKSGVGREQWMQFNQNEASNNHLLTSTEEIGKTLRSINKGDQVSIKGYLAEYSHGGGFKRGTSITRTDDGNGACETIFVTEVRILKKANFYWHEAYKYSRYLILLSLVVFLALPFFKKF